MKQRFRLPLNLQLFGEGDPADTDTQDTPPKKVELTPEQQAAVDALIKDRLSRQKKKFDDEKTAAQAEAERKEREKNEEYKALYESAQAELDRARSEAKTAALNATKTQLLVEAGYSAEQLARVSKYVVGEDEEAIKASIDEVIADMPPKSGGIDPNLNNGGRPPVKTYDPKAAVKERLDRLKQSGKR
ncbi:hypothetical protein [Paenibacillus dakarensis]|uniref:hypothetical protein n=1 Tax=Paenibacillus dakarensis TaxID=1527293 RepID=UPI0006D5ABAC|nr:hypothetical protein [Paenibacillus dakarensis]